MPPARGLLCLLPLQALLLFQKLPGIARLFIIRQGLGQRAGRGLLRGRAAAQRPAQRVRGRRLLRGRRRGLDARPFGTAKGQIVLLGYSQPIGHIGAGRRLIARAVLRHRNGRIGGHGDARARTGHVHAGRRRCGGARGLFGPAGLRRGFGRGAGASGAPGRPGRFGRRIKGIVGDRVVLRIGDALRRRRAVGRGGQLFHHGIAGLRLRGGPAGARAVDVHHIAVIRVGAVAHDRRSGRILLMNRLLLLPAPPLVDGRHIAVVQRRAVIVQAAEKHGTNVHAVSFQKMNSGLLHSI